MHNRLKLSVLLLTATTIMGCSSDNNDDPKPNKSRPITVTVTERPMRPEGMDASVLSAATKSQPSSRAAITTTETLAGFSMCGVFDDKAYEYTVKKFGEAWTTSPASWIGPARDDDQVPFYAFTSGTFYLNDSAPYVSFTVSENASTQHDLLVATNTVAYNDHSGNVPLTFDHACAAVEFNVYITNKLHEALGGALTVSSIKLSGVCNTGRYYFATGWQDVSGTADYTLTNGNITVTTYPQPLSSNCLFMIPQTWNEGMKLQIAYVKDGQSKTADILLTGGSWEPGLQYTIDIALGTKTIQ